MLYIFMSYLCSTFCSVVHYNKIFGFTIYLIFLMVLSLSHLNPSRPLSNLLICWSTLSYMQFGSRSPLIAALLVCALFQGPYGTSFTADTQWWNQAICLEEAKMQFFLWVGCSPIPSPAPGTADTATCLSYIYFRDTESCYCQVFLLCTSVLGACRIAMNCHTCCDIVQISSPKPIYLLCSCLLPPEYRTSLVEGPQNLLCHAIQKLCYCLLVVIETLHHQPGINHYPSLKLLNVQCTHLSAPAIFFFLDCSLSVAQKYCLFGGLTWDCQHSVFTFYNP